VTEHDFRDQALSLPEAVESSHFGCPDFRVRKRIFATLAFIKEGRAVVKLTPEQQRQFIAGEPGVFAPVPGGWGRMGMTTVELAAATHETLHPALLTAWRNVAPKRLVKEYDDGE
jgi:hypothetical protein